MSLVLVGLLQGVYYVLTGVLPLISMRVFESMTGPKRDHWLVKTVGLLVIVIGVVILYSVSQQKFPVETVMLAVGSAGALALIDIIYVAKGRIRKVYLLDAAAEILLIALWLFAK